MRPPAPVSAVAIATLALALADGRAGDDAGRDVEGAAVVGGSLVWDGSLALDGARSGTTAGRALADVGVDVDLDRAFGWDGVRLYVGVQALRGGPGGALADEYQAHSDIDAPTFETGIGWIEARSPARRFRVRAGVMDANDAFAVPLAGGSFLNASAGFSPSIVFLPTYPDPRPGIEAHGDAASWGASAGLYDADGDATFAIAELRRWGSGERGAGVRVVAGAWRHDPGTGAGTAIRGIYAVVERRFAAAAGDPRWTVWTSGGLADDRAGEVDRHLAAGVVVHGPTPRRPHDTIGVLVTWAGVRPGPEATVGGETVVEVHRRFRWTRSLTIQPDVQWIRRPGGVAGAEDATIATLRLEWTF